MKSALSGSVWSAVRWAGAVATVGVLLVGAVLPVALPADAAEAVRAAFRTVCHQIPERTFHVGGQPLAVCHRCLGIYAGLAAGAALVLPLRHRAQRWAGLDRWVLLAAIVPAGLDWGLDVIGLGSNTVATRVATGLWLGLLVGFVFARSLAWRPERARPWAEPEV